MSSFTKVQTDITDQDLLAGALTQMGYQSVESHETAQKLMNHWDGSQYGQHGEATAEVIVRKANLRAKHDKLNISDVGFKRGANGKFELQVNDMDRRVFDQEWIADVAVSVGITKAVRMARRRYGCTRPIIKDIETAAGPKRVVKFVIPGNV